MMKDVFGEQTWDKDMRLKAYHEMRLEVEGEPIYIGLKSGTAEYFGTELTTDKRYEFVKGTRIAIFTYHGCVLQLDGPSLETIFITANTPMTEYVNTHRALEQKRQAAKPKDERGPVVLAVGYPAVGKSTLCRILLNYAARKFRTPMYVDLDVSQNALSVPGIIATAVITRTADLQKGFDDFNPLVFHFGHTTAEANDELYKLLVETCAEQSLRALRGSRNKKVRNSGIIINTSGWVKGAGYKQILKAFEVDTILVLEKEQLHNQLCRDLPPTVTVAHLSKSDGVEAITPQMVTENCIKRLKEYFYGALYKVYPHIIEVKFEHFKPFKIETMTVPESRMPHGFKTEEYKMRLVPVQISPQSKHFIVAVSHAKGAAPDVTAIKTNIKGFLCITDIDMTRKVVKVFSPQPWEKMKNVLFLSTLQFDDSHT